MHIKIPLHPNTMQGLFNNAYLDKRLSVSLHIKTWELAYALTSTAL